MSTEYYRGDSALPAETSELLQSRQSYSRGVLSILPVLILYDYR